MFGHKCPLPKQLFVMDSQYPDEEPLEESSLATETIVSTAEWSKVVVDNPLISLYALSCLQVLKLFMWWGIVVSDLYRYCWMVVVLIILLMLKMLNDLVIKLFQLR